MSVDPIEKFTNANSVNFAFANSPTRTESFANANAVNFTFANSSITIEKYDQNQQLLWPGRNK